MPDELDEAFSDYIKEHGPSTPPPTAATGTWLIVAAVATCLAMLAPLNALTFVAADVRAARALACVSMACAVAQWAMQRRVRFAGMRAL